MIILPAIDIKDGACVRLYKGDFSTVHTILYQIKIWNILLTCR